MRWAVFDNSNCNLQKIFPFVARITLRIIRAMTSTSFRLEFTKGKVKPTCMTCSVARLMIGHHLFHCLSCCVYICRVRCRVLRFLNCFRYAHGRTMVNKWECLKKVLSVRKELLESFFDVATSKGKVRLYSLPEFFRLGRAEDILDSDFLAFFHYQSETVTSQKWVRSINRLVVS